MLEFLISICAYALIYTATSLVFGFRWPATVWNLMRGAMNKVVRYESVVDRAFRTAMEIDTRPPPEHQIVAWTPQEREVLGINDTIRLIAHIDDELDKPNRAVREKLAAMTPTGSPSYSLVEAFNSHIPAPTIAEYADGGIVVRQS